MSEGNHLPSLWHAYRPVVQHLALGSAVVCAATTLSGTLALGVAAGQVAGIVRAVAAAHDREELRRRLLAMEQAVERCRRVERDVDDILKRVREATELGSQGPIRSPRDIRHAADLFAEALAADDDPTARQLACAAARALAGQTRTQRDAAALALLHGLSAGALDKLRPVYGRNWPEGNAPHHQDSALRQGWTYDDVVDHATIGTIVHNVPAHRHTLEPSYWIRLTRPCARLLELTAEPAEELTS